MRKFPGRFRPFFFLAPLLLLCGACSKLPDNPNLSLERLRYCQVSMSPTINGQYPGTTGTRPLLIRGVYSAYLFGLLEGKRFELAPEIEAQLGNERKISNLRVRTWSDPLQMTLKGLSLYMYEPRTIEVTGDIWLNSGGPMR